MRNITAIPAFESNYIWMLPHRSSLDEVWVVDPGDALAVNNALALYQKHLGGILITHRHEDHIGGVDALRELYDVPVYGPASKDIPCVTTSVKDQEAIELGGYSATILSVPGHTDEHIAYHLPELTALFCGDALFAGGCGRVFDDKPLEHFASLQKLAQLPGHTAIYCAHEYTLSNLAFALKLEPDSILLQERLIAAEINRSKNIPTVPSLLSLELETNPFLRCDQPSIRSFAQTQLQVDEATPENVFVAIRRFKDHN